MLSPAHESILTLKLVSFSLLDQNRKATAGRPLSMAIGIGLDLLFVHVLKHTALTTKDASFLGVLVGNVTLRRFPIQDGELSICGLLELCTSFSPLAFPGESW